MGYLITLLLYLIIGLYLYYLQDNWIHNQDPEFKLTFKEWFRFFSMSVFLWLPTLIEYWFFTNNKKNEKD